MEERERERDVKVWAISKSGRTLARNGEKKRRMSCLRWAIGDRLFISETKRAFN